MNLGGLVLATHQIP